MTVRRARDRDRWLVTVHRAAALPGFQRIRRYVYTLEAAEALEAEIEASIQKFGKWPADPKDKPLKVLATPNIMTSTVRRPTGPTGTLREAADLAILTHWHGQRYERSVTYIVRSLVSFFEANQCPDIDDITSEDIDQFIIHMRQKNLAPGTMNKALGALRMINKVALKRLPPLCTVTLPIPHIRGRRVEKWWMRPEDHQKVVTELRNPVSGNLMTDPMFADLIDIICYQGLRVEEALRIEPRMVVGLDTEEPWIKPPGTKTSDAQNSIPIYPEAVAPLRTSIERADKHRWTRLFPYRERQVMNKWNEVREFLGVRHIPTATMKSLRRTFAWYANHMGMPTSTLQKVLRHKGIATTAGYLELVGDNSLSDSRKYFIPKDSTTRPQVEPERPTIGSNIGAIIQAYAQTPGVTPEDVAKFAKELMI